MIFERTYCKTLDLYTQIQPPNLAKCKKFAKSHTVQKKNWLENNFERTYCKRRKLKLTHHCIDERSEELAVRGGISVESLLV